MANHQLIVPLVLAGIAELAMIGIVVRWLVTPTQFLNAPTKSMTKEEVTQRVAAIEANLRQVGNQLYELNNQAEQAGEAEQLTVFYPILDEIRSYISYPDYSNPHYDE